MDDITTLAQIIAVLTVVVVPIAFIARFLDSRDSDPLSDPAVPTRMPWPRGVQEEDPRPWHFKPVAC
jgi:hypothetical protein